MTESSNSHRSYRLAGSLFPLGLCCLFALQSLVSTGFAGCHDRGAEVMVFDGEDAGGLPQWHWWTGDGVRRVYEGGRFTYYQVLGGALPCHGPSCDGRPARTSFTVVVSIDTQRVSPPFSQPIARCLPARLRAQRLCFDSGVSHSNPILPGPFRPPSMV